MYFQSQFHSWNQWSTYEDNHLIENCLKLGRYQPHLFYYLLKATDEFQMGHVPKKWQGWKNHVLMVCLGSKPIFSKESALELPSD